MNCMFNILLYFQDRYLLMEDTVAGLVPLAGVVTCLPRDLAVILPCRHHLAHLTRQVSSSSFIDVTLFNQPKGSIYF